MKIKRENSRVKSLLGIEACLIFVFIRSDIMTAATEKKGKEEAVVCAAKNWLNQIDKGNYAESKRRGMLSLSIRQTGRMVRSVREEGLRR